MKQFRSFFKTVEGNEGKKCNYPTRLDTYGCGCQHDCKYCYAKSLLDFRGMWDANEPSVAPIEDIEKVVKKLPKEVVRLGGMTDCYMPLERQVRNTRKTIELLNKYRVPYLIVTKSALILDDKMVLYLMETDDMTAEEAVDFISYNTIRSLSYYKDSPIVVYSLTSEFEEGNDADS